jgi:hypothetical protein
VHQRREQTSIYLPQNAKAWAPDEVAFSYLDSASLERVRRRHRKISDCATLGIERS